MLPAILTKPWKPHHMKQELYSHLPPISKTSKLDEHHIRDTSGESKANLNITFSYRPLHTDVPVFADRQELNDNTSIRILYVRDAYDKFLYFFVWVFKIVVDFWKLTTLLLYMLWDDWQIFMISVSNEQQQQQLEYTLLKPDCHSRWI